MSRQRRRVNQKVHPAVTKSPIPPLRRDLLVADWLGRRDLYAIGASGPERRRELQRQEILTRGLADQSVKPKWKETWRELFRRMHGEDLEAEATTEAEEAE